MWLVNTASLRLEYFIDHRDEELFYAILSHTWDEGEVSFQEFISNLDEVKAKPGYRKVVQTCARALREGYKYAWIDTCCINKESSAELSEAINSMWTWYCDARICYAYLSDIDGDCPVLEHKRNTSYPNQVLEDGMEIEKVPHQLSVWLEKFRGSRWFTRGWTLQELIAPREIEFFNREWKFIGRKRELIHDIEKATGIDEAVIQSRVNLSRFVIARKMSWAAGRKTSRIEDRAYSLLGIFNINMPLLYGEGGKAFIRLQEYLVQTSTDHSILVWSSPSEWGKFSWETRDTLFARDPEEFRIGSRVTGLPSSMHDSHHVLTSKGLEFHSSLFVDDETQSLMLLNCHFEDNLHGPLALRLSQPRGSIWDVKQEWPVWPHKNDYCVGSKTDLGVFDARLQGSRRLAICEAYKAAIRPADAITVLRYLPYCTDLLHYPPSMLEMAYTLKIWLKQSPQCQESFEIRQAAPEKYWNISTGVLSISRNNTGLYHGMASAILDFTASGTRLSIIFRYPSTPLFTIPYSENDKNIPEITNDFRSRISVSLCDPHAPIPWKRQLEKYRPCLMTESADENGTFYSVSVTTGEIMGEVVFIIEVSANSISPS